MAKLKTFLKTGFLLQIYEEHRTRCWLLKSLKTDEKFDNGWVRWQHSDKS